MMQVRFFPGGCSLRERASRWFPTIPVLLVLTSASIALTTGPALSANLQPGWPQTTPTAPIASAALGDLEGDGDLEVCVTTTDGLFRIWHHDGTPVSGWPKAMGGSGARPAVGDLDGDGDLEIVVSATRPPGEIWETWEKDVSVWHHDGTALAGWPKTFDYVMGIDKSIPALGDLDGDGDLEVIFMTHISPSGFLGFRAFHHDGTTVAGWPKSVAVFPEGSPGVGDLDADGDLEVVFVGLSPVGPGPEYPLEVHAFHHDATGVDGWPAVCPREPEYGFFPSTALGDLDGDGKLEVVLGSNDGSVYVWHHDGTTMAGWPQAAGALATPSPVLGDVDGDGDLEVVAGSNDGSVYAWHHDGTAVTGWPNATGGTFTSVPALADLDGDADLEVVAGSDYGSVCAWHHDGTAVTGWPNATGGSAAKSPALADLDGDGDLEVVVGSNDHKVYVWTCDVPTDDSLPWPMFGHDWRRTGCYRKPLIAKFNADPACGAPPLAVEFTDQSTGSPDSWSWDFGDEGISTEQHPWRVYETMGRYTVSLAVSNWCNSDSEVKDHHITVTFPDVLCDHWACDEVLSCAQAGIVSGYEDGFYHPEQSVTRGQMAVYISRGLAGGDENVPEFTGTPTFPDVPEGFWALDYVEHSVEQNIVAGYEDGTYHPEHEVTRDQMAVYVARALVAPQGDAGLPYVPADPHNFPDVSSDFWCYTHIEYCVENGVVTGYEDGLYHPEIVVTRDQMAVYVARAFGLVS